MSDLEGQIIKGVDASAPPFLRSLRRIKDQRLTTEICGTLRSLLFQRLDQLPRRLHLHQLTGKRVPSRLDPSKKVPAWSLHVTADDCYKASFTLEDGVVFLRLCDEHDVIDRAP